MEGDAGASRLNPNDTDDSSSSEVGTDQTSTEDSPESEDASDQRSRTAKAEDSSESEDAADRGRVTESDADDRGGTGEHRRSGRSASRLGRGWFVGIAAALVVLAGGVGAGGYLALRSHRDSQAIARRDAAAMEAAKDCVAATQAPDTHGDGR